MEGANLSSFLVLLNTVTKHLNIGDRCGAAQVTNRTSVARSNKVPARLPSNGNLNCEIGAWSQVSLVNLSIFCWRVEVPGAASGRLGYGCLII